MMKTHSVVLLILVAVVIGVAERPPWVSLHAQQTRESPPTQAQQRPVFRGGTHFVRVDAYPAQDGKIVEGADQNRIGGITCADLRRYSR